MDTLMDPAPPVDIAGQSFDVRVLDAGQLDIVRATIKSWLDSHGIPQLASLSETISLTRATLVPLVKLQLRTRTESRSVTSKQEVFKQYASYENRNFKDDSFFIWSYLVEGAGTLQPGVVPPPVTQKVCYSDLITGCAACGAIGSTLCGSCGGRGERQCGSCRGDLEITCTSCRGAGEKKCSSCNGHGEKTCYSCRSGTSTNGERCTSCHGRGFKRCNACRDGFTNCGTCARQGIIRCPSCAATGRVRCGGCGGAGRKRCAPCEGSGKFVTSLYLTVKQSEQLAATWVLPPGCDGLVPENVSTWLREDVGIAAARELSAKRFEAAPCEPAGSPLAKAAQRLLDESGPGVRHVGKVDLAVLANGAVDQVVQQWYAEYHLPLVKVDYQWEGKAYTLWTVAPGETLNDHEEGFARKGSPVFAAEGPVAAYAERQLEAAASILEEGKLAESRRRADALLKILPGFRKAALLKAAGIRAQRRFAALGSFLALAGASAFCFARLQAALPAPLSPAAITGLVLGVLAVAAPFGVRRIVYRTKMIALAGQCALVGAILFPVVASLRPAAPSATADPAAAPAAPAVPAASAATPAPVIAPKAVEARAPASAVAPGFDCARSSTAVEKMICADRHLSTLDGTLARLYKDALASVDDPRALRAAQRTWLRTARNRCPDPACLAQAYALRIAGLERKMNK